MIISRVKIRFSQWTRTLCPIFVFFKTGVFLVLCVFSNLFLSKLPQFLLESKRFASVEDFLGFSALCDLPEIFVRKISNFFSTFLSCFRLCKIDFLFSPVGKKDVLESHAYSFGYFWHCKILTIVFFFIFEHLYFFDP